MYVHLRMLNLHSTSCLLYKRDKGVSVNTSTIKKISKKVKKDIYIYKYIKVTK